MQLPIENFQGLSMGAKETDVFHFQHVLTIKSGHLSCQNYTLFLLSAFSKGHQLERAKPF